MTPEERQLLNALGDRIKGAPAQDRDGEAEQVIGELVRSRPDTTYILAQTVIMQDFALRNAQAQITDLQRQLQAARDNPPQQKSGSFLSGLFGGATTQAPATGSVPPANPWRPQAQQPAPGGYAPQQAYAPAGYAQSPAYAPVVMQPDQTSGFLRSAATTAVGVAGGALLFEGIQSLFSGHGGVGGGWGGNMGGFGGGPWGGGGFEPRESLSETTIVNNNNYYDTTNTTTNNDTTNNTDNSFFENNQGGSQDQPLDTNYTPPDQAFVPDQSLTDPSVDLGNYADNDSGSDVASNDFGGGGNDDDYA